MQEIVERALSEKITELQKNGVKQAGKGAVVAIDPNTGGILAMASYPSFNPNSFFADYNELVADPHQPQINKAIQGTYPVGSTFKLVGTLAALEEGVITKNSRVLCRGVKSFFGSDRRRCFGSHAHGALNVVGAIRISCNIFFYEMGYRLGFDRLSAYAKDFGFGQPTGLTDIRGERAGSIAAYEYPGDVLTAAIGQKHEITPLQLANYAAILANQGIRYRPYLVQEVVSHDGQVIFKAQPEVLDRLPYAKENWEIARLGMEAVSQPGGTASLLRDLPVKVASKTGSAQTGNKDPHSLYIGYAPSEAPEVALAIILEHSGLGGQAAVPVAKQIWEEYFTPVAEEN